MEKELGKVDSVFLGVEDHGIFSFNLGFRFPGSGQGLGHYGLEDFEDPDRRRISFKGAIPLLRQVLRVFGKQNIMDLKGSPCYVLREGGMIRGIEATGLDGAKAGEQIIFKEFFDQYR
jgi:hypothetical protein